MNTPFLEKLAAHVAEKYSGSLPETCIVLPNRRSGLFFRKFLGRTVEKDMIAPLILSIEDFMFNASKLIRAEPLALMLELYRAYRNTTTEEPRPLDQFMGMGKSILNDFNETDLYLVDADDIFTHLSDIKAMSLWNLDGAPLTEFQKNYLRFYRSQASLYKEFRKRLFDRGIAYQGMAYQEALKQYPEYLEKNRVSKVVFAGLNALSKAEEELVKLLLSQDKAEIFWDADSYYLDNKDHEAGRFLQRHFRSWSRDHKNWISQELTEGEKKISIAGIPGNITQAKYAGERLKKIWEKDPEMEQTAVVLADEKLLVPLLNSIPGEIREMNITMGYPFKFTPAYSFFKRLLRLHENPDGTPRTGFYTPDLLKLIQHPYFHALFKKEVGFNTGEALKTLRASNKITYLPEELSVVFSSGNEKIEPVFSVIFSPWKTPEEVVDALTGLINRLKSNFLEEGTRHSLDVEYLFYFARIVNKLSSLLPEYPEIGNLKTARKILLQAAESVSIPFYGEPLKGLQIMGMLETRTVDFRNLIILSVNENILPSGRNYNSFIPIEIKNHYKIPTYYDRDAVYAYHFYRLLQRAQNVEIIYNTEQDRMGKGEKSRYVAQLLLELGKHNSNISIEEKTISIPPPEKPVDTPIVIEKNDKITGLLKEKASKGFSPSSLHTYINCPLQFYFNYVAGLKEEEEVEETIQSKTLGDVVHYALKYFYQKLRSGDVTADKLEPSAEEANAIIEEAFRQQYKEGDISQGLNLLISRLARAYFLNYLKFERNLLNENPGMDIRIELLEEEVKHPLEIRTGNENIKTYVGGKIDRADRMNGRYRVIDYKTGFVEPSQLSVKEIGSLFEDPDEGYPFQLMVYAWALSSSKGIPPETVDAGIFSLRKPSSGVMQVSLPGGLNADTLREFEAGLAGIIGEIFDTGIPFTQADDIERCKWCPYREICNRL